jgi:DNA-directed RNA polymerase specialized sigma24 family protein
VNATKEGEHLEEIVLTHIDMLYNVAHQLTGDAASAELLARRTLVKTLRPGAERPPATPIKSWLLTTMRQVFLEEFARKRKCDLAI